MGLVKPLVMSLQVGQPSRSGSEPALWGRLVQLCSLSCAPFLESKGFWSCQGQREVGAGVAGEPEAGFPELPSQPSIPHRVPVGPQGLWVPGCPFPLPPTAAPCWLWGHRPSFLNGMSARWGFSRM